MINILPQTGSQTFRIRTSVPCDVTPLSLKLILSNIETNSDLTITNVTGSYDKFDFLNVEAQYPIAQDVYHTIQVIQTSASVDCTTLYRGEIFSTTSSSDVKTSSPFVSYTNETDNIWITA